MSNPIISISFLILKRPNFFIVVKNIIEHTDAHANIDNKPMHYQPKKEPQLGKP